MEELFFELVRISLGQRVNLSHSPTQREWKGLFAMAGKQALLGVCFAAIRQLGQQKQHLHNELYFQWLAVAAQIQERNEDMNRHCVELQRQLYEAGFKSCILKGQGVAMNYPETLNMLRQPGDIDIWVEGSKDKIIEYVMTKAPTKEFDQKHIHFHIFDNTDVEVHWKPVEPDNPRMRRVLDLYFRQEAEWQFGNKVSMGDGTEMTVPTNDFQLTHQLLHVYRHYLYEGVGLRQLMDCYFTLLVCNDEERQKVMALMERLKMMWFVGAVMWVFCEVFSISREKLLCATNEKEGRRLMETIMEGGNFGQGDHRNNAKGESSLHRFWRRMERKVQLFRYDPLGTLLFPFERVKLELWMRKVRKQYKV